jgi:hypothetical protein
MEALAVDAPATLEDLAHNARLGVQLIESALAPLAGALDGE